MKQRIEITVSVPDRSNIGNYKDVFKVVNIVDDSVLYDFQSVVKGLRCLYPDEAAVISFKILS